MRTTETNITRVDINYNYIKKLAIFLKKENLQELFTALVLTERYTFIDDLRRLTRKEIDDANKKYSEFVRSRDSLLNRRWIKWL